MINTEPINKTAAFVVSRGTRFQSREKDELICLEVDVYRSTVMIPDLMGTVVKGLLVRGMQARTTKQRIVCECTTCHKRWCMRISCLKTHKCNCKTKSAP